MQWHEEIATTDPDLLEIIRQVRINQAKLRMIEDQIELVPDSEVDRTIVENLANAVNQGITLLLTKVFGRLESKK